MHVRPVAKARMLLPRLPHLSLLVLLPEQLLLFQLLWLLKRLLWLLKLLLSLLLPLLLSRFHHLLILL
jgi:hypothetical protein